MGCSPTEVKAMGNRQVLQTARIRQEHQSLLRELARLDAALEALVCYSEVYANFASALELYRCTRTLADHVPGHFAREETTVLEDVADLGPAARDFVAAMKHEHLELQRRLDLFCFTLDQLQHSADLECSISQLKQRGREFTHEMASHMGSEERRIAALQA